MLSALDLIQVIKREGDQLSYRWVGLEGLLNGLIAQNSDNPAVNLISALLDTDSLSNLEATKTLMEGVKEESIDVHP